jgi:hypothetical protein
MAPVRAGLAEAQHMQAAGTMGHDRTVARRAEEAFNPTRTVPDLGRAIRRAPLTALPPVRHALSDGERTAGEELNRVHRDHGTDFSSSVVMVTVPTPPYHALHVDVEVDQDRTGAVLTVRIVQSSRVGTLDETATRAVREALGQVRAIRLETGRRSRWRFEVSEAVPIRNPVASELLSPFAGGNEGWRVLNESSDGVPIRIRVRMTGARPLPGS